MSEVLLSLSQSVYINQPAHSGAIPTYSRSNNCLYCLYSLMVEGSSGSRGEEVLQSLSVVGDESASGESLSEAKKCLLRVLGEESDGVRLKNQLRSLWGRVVSSVRSREVLSVYMDMLANESPMSGDCVDLLCVLSEECSGAFMHWSLQVGLFGLLQRYLVSVSEGVRLKKRTKRMWGVFARVLWNQSRAYSGHEDVLLDDEGVWKEEYNSELLPLLDMAMEEMYSFPAEMVDNIVGVVMRFWRVMRSGDESVDQRLRIRYNEWVGSYLSGVSVSKSESRVKSDLRCVCRRLRGV